jgi:hypothetical protein
MVSLADQLARERSALFGFVESISASCTQPPNTVAFTDPSERFFRYINQLATQTKLYLTVHPVATDSTDEDFQDSRQELSTIQSVWRELH